MLELSKSVAATTLPTPARRYPPSPRRSSRSPVECARLRGSVLTVCHARSRDCYAL